MISSGASIGRLFSEGCRHSIHSSDLDIRADHRLSASDRRPHRFAEHRVDAGTAVLHLARNPHWLVC